MLKSIYKNIFLFMFLHSVCNSSIAQTACINYEPIPIGSSFCQGVSLLFNDCSNGATSWSWNFGFGAIPQTSNQQNPGLIQYPVCGLNTVSLIINGNADTAEANFTVWCNPNACFSANPYFTCVGSPFTFDASCSMPGTAASISYYQWDFGGGDTLLIDPIINKTYDSAGCFSVSLVITNSHGCTDFLTLNDLVCDSICTETKTDFNENTNIQIAPNPAKSVVEIFYSSSIKINNIEVFNLVGKKMMEAQQENNNNNHYTLYLNGFPVGSYFIRFSTFDGVIIKKISLQ